MNKQAPFTSQHPLAQFGQQCESSWSLKALKAGGRPTVQPSTAFLPSHWWKARLQWTVVSPSDHTKRANSLRNSRTATLRSPVTQDSWQAACSLEKETVLDLVEATVTLTLDSGDNVICHLHHRSLSLQLTCEEIKRTCKWGCGSVAEDLTSMCEFLSSTPSFLLLN